MENEVIHGGCRASKSRILESTTEVLAETIWRLPMCLNGLGGRGTSEGSPRLLILCVGIRDQLLVCLRYPPVVVLRQHSCALYLYAPKTQQQSYCDPHVSFEYRNADHVIDCKIHRHITRAPQVVLLLYTFVIACEIRMLCLYFVSQFVRHKAPSMPL